MKLILNKKAGHLVAFYFSDRLDAAGTQLKETNRFAGKAGEVFVDFDLAGKGQLLVGLGSFENTDPEEVRLAGFALAGKIAALKLEAVALRKCMLGERAEELLPLFVEGLYHGAYEFDEFLSEKRHHEFTVYLPEITDALAEKLAEVEKVMTGVYLTRDLINLPNNIIYPESYAKRIQKEFAGLPVEVTVYDEKAMEKLGMHAALAVGKGSINQPRFVVLKYQPQPANDQFIALVGKGVTYDSGGYAIKPARSMLTMKTDMSGSAAVVGAIKALALNNIKQNVYGFMTLCDNLISGKAYKNGDIISSMKGLSIEVDNTDAEGRLTMADSLYYAATQVNSQCIIELSTLTGACIVALGTDVTGSIATDDALFAQVSAAGQAAGELIHRFPVTKKLQEAVKGKMGDLKNVAEGGGGSITAGIFLTHFVEDKPYVHLDIAGTAYNPPYSYYKNGASGVGVRTLYNFVKNYK